ncbi:hypothetical protein [Diatraea saccharalis granulovirus]|uniref:Ac81 n=1 Tax=Diatraea saccharalis granulovirus TaxID=1675862 RepID=A0A0R7EYX2_9BBAC|nr:hypothetical protein [Diatraea saccharalis granulovirus]AKN80779.1 hypothetical protein [Diatraea saccharalis granulovirus]
MSSLNNNKRIKYDSQLLLKYVFDYDNKKGGPNIINICRVRVRKVGGAVLAHYYAQIYLDGGYNFEFHPGSQPKSFQNINDKKDYVIIKSLILCEECCRKELEEYLLGENEFNIAFQNCESILCKRKSVQSVVGATLFIVLLINIAHFTIINIFLIAFLVFLLYVVNNHLLMEPRIEYCKHYGHSKMEHCGQYDRFVQE